MLLDLVNIMTRKKTRIYGYHNTKIGYLCLAPFLILFFLFTILPVLASIVLSFTDYDMLRMPKFVGFSNYTYLFLEDDIFIIALKNTFTFALISGPLSYIMSFLFAWLICQTGKLRNFFSLAFYAPSICSGIAMSTVWLYFFSSDSYGFINNTLMSIGIISSPIQWTLDTNYILGVVIFISVWMGMGTSFLTFIAGFQGLSEELSEAAKIDGIRNSTQELVYIILPQMKPQLLFGAINSIVAAFGVFEIAVAVGGFPSPDYAAHTLVGHLYDFAFTRFEMGYASCVAVILFAITYSMGKIVRKVLASD